MEWRSLFWVSTQATRRDSAAPVRALSQIYRQGRYAGKSDYAMSKPTGCTASANTTGGWNFMRIVDSKYAVSYKIIGHTFLILMLLISFLNLMSVLVIYGYSQISRALNTPYEDVRSKLPNYSDKDQAFKIFKEFASLETTYIPFI